jgi:hypothetical protein
MSSHARFAALAASAALLCAGSALGVTDEEKCQVKKIKEAEKYVKCLLKAEDKAIKAGGVLPDLSSCTTKFAQKWAKVESKGGSSCTTQNDEAAMQSKLEAVALDILNRLMPATANFACDALGQSDCPGEACYVNTIVEPATSQCASVFGPANTQGDVCGAINDCAIGHSCLLITSPQDSTLTCAFHCDTQGGSPSCADGGVPSFDCVSPSLFYSDVNRTPANFGICIDPNVFPNL